MSHINTMGAWKYVDGDVYLQSDSGITSRNGEVVEEITSTLNGMQIQFFTVDCKHLYGTVDICVNDSIFIKTDSGELNVPFRLKSFYARFSSNSYYYYKVKDSRANHLRVCLLPVSREFFLSNEKFKLKDRGLIGRNDTKLIKQLD